MKARKTYSLRQLREAAGLTLDKVGAAIDVSPSTIQALETGRGKNYNVVLKHKVADYFHVPMFALFPEERERVALITGKTRQIQMYVPAEEVKKD